MTNSFSETSFSCSFYPSL